MLNQIIGSHSFFYGRQHKKKSRSVRTRDQKIQNHVALNHEDNRVAKLRLLVKN